MKLNLGFLEVQKYIMKLGLYQGNWGWEKRERGHKHCVLHKPRFLFMTG